MNKYIAAVRTFTRKSIKLINIEVTSNLEALNMTKVPRTIYITKKINAFDIIPFAKNTQSI